MKKLPTTTTVCPTTTRWTEWAYPVPDDQFKTLQDIMRSLPDGPDIETVWERMPYFVVVVADPLAAMYLRLAVRNGLPTDDDGTPLLGENEVWIAEDEREECERMLAEDCRSAAVWTAFAKIAFASEAAHADFRAAYVNLADRAPPDDHVQNYYASVKCE